MSNATGPTQYTLRRAEDSNVLTHGGPQALRNFELLVNGKLFETFSERSQKIDYVTQDRFDKEVRRRVEHLRKFWPGPLKTINRKPSD